MWVWCSARPAEALDRAREVLEGKTSKATMRPVTEEPFILASVARAAAMVGAARSYVFDTLGDISETLEAGLQLSSTNGHDGRGL